MVFQTYALYPHMTVYMAFGLKQAKTRKDEIDRRVGQPQLFLKYRLYLTAHRAHHWWPASIVAIGRAIVRNLTCFCLTSHYQILMLPRCAERIEIARLHKRLGTTMIYVTHDQVEAMTLADKIVVLRDGNIEQVGSPIEL